MTHGNDLEVLVQGIYRPSLFYIPNNIFPDLTPEQEKEFNDYRVINAVGVLKANGDTTYANKCSPTVELLSKPTQLENNVYQLQKLRDELSKETFDYLLGEYQKHILTCKYVYDWLLNNTNEAINEVTKEELSLFKLQLDWISSHIDKVQAVFCLDRKQTEETPEELTELPNSVFNNKAYNNILKKENLSKDKPTKVKKSKKANLPSEQDIDAYLLETVFNVNFKE
ncbi:hypothetical protein RBH94_08480 [Aestuariibaculum sp. YM273]|uniref:hypothetical protein n=1 Tax=Aestuariibaculum sp. YM273 TaxID=3070659 RepID=UPI0027DD7C13|nr:hypothetical protein [Aestuariibaculum sp. YM273]WMI64106.1 hypothetical protein RBH94_08480 [Aestuariibaculum sp. YM273]